MPLVLVGRLVVDLLLDLFGSPVVLVPLVILGEPMLVGLPDLFVSGLLSHRRRGRRRSSRRSPRLALPRLVEPAHDMASC